MALATAAGVSRAVGSPGVVLWLVPQFALMGVGDGFALVRLLRAGPRLHVPLRADRDGRHAAAAPVAMGDEVVEDRFIFIRKIYARG